MADRIQTETNLIDKRKFARRELRREKNDGKHTDVKIMEMMRQRR